MSGETRFTLTVKRGVEYKPMECLSEYELRSRIDTLRGWFGLSSDDFDVKVAEESPESEGRATW